MDSQDSSNGLGEINQGIGQLALSSAIDQARSTTEQDRTSTSNAGISKDKEESSSDHRITLDDWRKSRKHLPPKVIDLKTFIDKTNHRPIFSRALLENAAEQLQKSSKGEIVELLDCFGGKHEIEKKEGFDPSLVYNNIHTLADEEPFSMVKDLPKHLREETDDDLTEKINNARMPIYISFPLKDRSAFFENSYTKDVIQKEINRLRPFWEKSRGRKVLVESLEIAAETARIDKIVCIGHGSLEQSSQSCIQHLATLTIAQELKKIYTASGGSAVDIKIATQDPMYTRSDQILLQRPNPPFKIVDDPQAFLEIDSSTLVFSSAPSIPVKQIVADLATEDPTRRPAAIFWTPSDDELGPDLDNPQYTYDWETYRLNPNSIRCEEVLETYVQAFDSEEYLDNVSDPDAMTESQPEGTKWIFQPGMQLFLRTKE